MPFDREQVLPRLVALTCGASALSGLRARSAASLSGRVVEIGFGSGFNRPHYPGGVDRVLAMLRSPGFDIEEVEQKHGSGPRARAYLTRASAVRA